MQIPKFINYIDTDALKTVSSIDIQNLMAWGIKHSSPETESSIFKGIPNTKQDLAMVKIFRKVAKRVVVKTSFLRGIYGNLRLFRAYRLKGRGSRKQFNYNSNQSLRCGDAETFALYAHDNVDWSKI